ncbi:hypothetical protein T265_08320 [Opisthorchis viverrini]|uniref:Uncharacterized protein n=1 Tax=Opisthorchis viverrini TaxID=6198 RepID=A0A074Z9J2_OPIVI|nr:hypothetical protein T265_08320 [Opisthorchis viverrini]KER23901.1 hypothetical protein T265_08320 [Opisthorchis viverrini]
MGLRPQCVVEPRISSEACIHQYRARVFVSDPPCVVTTLAWSPKTYCDSIRRKHEDRDTTRLPKPRQEQSRCIDRVRTTVLSVEVPLISKQNVKLFQVLAEYLRLFASCYQTFATCGQVRQLQENRKERCSKSQSVLHILADVLVPSVRVSPRLGSHSLIRDTFEDKRACL